MTAFIKLILKRCITCVLCAMYDCAHSVHSLQASTGSKIILIIGLALYQKKIILLISEKYYYWSKLDFLIKTYFLLPLLIVKICNFHTCKVDDTKSFLLDFTLLWALQPTGKIFQDTSTSEKIKGNLTSKVLLNLQLYIKHFWTEIINWYYIQFKDFARFFYNSINIPIPL